MSEVSSAVVKIRRDEFIAEIQQRLTDPVHKRLVAAYKNDQSVDSMETELGNILMEVIERED